MVGGLLRIGSACCEKARNAIDKGSGCIADPAVAREHRTKAPRCLICIEGPSNMAVAECVMHLAIGDFKELYAISNAVTVQALCPQHRVLIRYGQW
jgi:hypothetical protein